MRPLKDAALVGSHMANNAPEPGADDPLGVHGVVPPTVTAFDEDESVDYETTAAHARFVVDRGAHGVFPLGTNGEFPLLTPDERDRVVEAVVEEIGDDAPVIAGVGAPSTRQTVAHAEHAESVGADGVVVVTPYYYPVDHDAAVAHYRRVAEAVDLPVYVYHIPSKTGNSLSLDTLTFLAGSDSLLFPGLDLGCAGMVSAVANAFPELVVDLYEAYDEGDEERARQLQSEVYDVRDALKRGPYMAGVKTALGLREVGFDPGPLRSPLRTMDDDDHEALRANLSDLGLL